jgi:flagellin
MAFSVQTNGAALTALQNLNRTNDKLTDVQTRINTGLKVNGAKDNASTWAVAQGQRADIGALSAVRTSLDRATSIADVGLAAGETISDLLNEVKAKVTAAMDTSLTPQSRSDINNDFRALLNQIVSTVANAEFDGANILSGSLPGAIKFLANADADLTLDLTRRDFRLGQTSGIQILATDSLSSALAATSIMARVNASIDNVNGILAKVGSEAKQIEAHNKFISKLNDTLESGIGNLVDADLAKESARLQALQVQQQLGAQALGIANQSPQLILSLFQG